MRQAISPRLAIRILLNTLLVSHPEYTESRLGNGRSQAGGQTQPQAHARVRGIDDAIIPEAGRGVIGVSLRFVLRADRRHEIFLLGSAPGAALGSERRSE